MALKKWADIATFADLMPYLAAELRDFQAKCPSAAAKYQDSIDFANVQRVAMEGTTMEYPTVLSAMAIAQEARDLWHSNGCPPTGGSTSQPAPPDSEGGGGDTPRGGKQSSMMMWGVGALALGVIAFVVWGGKRGGAAPAAAPK